MDKMKFTITGYVEVDTSDNAPSLVKAQGEELLENLTMKIRSAMDYFEGPVFNISVTIPPFPARAKIAAETLKGSSKDF